MWDVAGGSWQRSGLSADVERGEPRGRAAGVLGGVEGLELVRRQAAERPVQAVVVDQPTHSTSASSSWDRVRQTRSAISSVLKLSTKLSAMALSYLWPPVTTRLGARRARRANCKVRQAGPRWRSPGLHREAPSRDPSAREGTPRLDGHAPKVDDPKSAYADLGKLTSLMRQPDGNLFELLADDVCRDLLRSMLREDEPQTQRQLTAALSLNSSTISRRMGQLENLGLVSRASSHAPYEILFPSKTRELLLAAAGLARLSRERQAAEAAAHERDLRKESMNGGSLRDLAREA